LKGIIYVAHILLRKLVKYFIVLLVLGINVEYLVCVFQLTLLEDLMAFLLLDLELRLPGPECSTW